MQLLSILSHPMMLLFMFYSDQLSRDPYKLLQLCYQLTALYQLSSVHCLQVNVVKQFVKKPVIIDLAFLLKLDLSYDLLPLLSGQSSNLLSDQVNLYS